MMYKSVELYHVAGFLSDFISCASLQLHDIGLLLGLYLQVEGDMGFYQWLLTSLMLRAGLYFRPLCCVLQTSVSLQVWVLFHYHCLCSRLISAGLNRFKFCAIDKDSAILITPKSLACIIAILAEQIKEAHLFPTVRSHNHGTMLEIH